MIYITGDTHRHINSDKLNLNNWAEQKELTKDDYLIICGDFGYVWDNSDFEMELRQWIGKKKFTTLFVDGNHDNHFLLNKFPKVNMFRSKVGKISDSIFHLKRGEIYEIDGKKIFCMGGAESIDKNSRTPGYSWWSEEIPNIKEFNKGIDNLKKIDYNIDIMITHTCPESIFDSVIEYRIKDCGVLEKYLEEIKLELSKRNQKYKHFFGHYHIDKQIDDIHTCIFDNIIKL